MFRWVVAAVVVFGVGVVLCYPWFDAEWSYRGVGPARGKVVVRPPDGPPCLIEDGELYLLFGKERRGIIPVASLEFVVWSAADVEELRRKYPEIDRDELWGDEGASGESFVEAYILGPNWVFALALFAVLLVLGLVVGSFLRRARGESSERASPPR